MLTIGSITLDRVRSSVSVATANISAKELENGLSAAVCHLLSVPCLESQIRIVSWTSRCILNETGSSLLGSSEPGFLSLVKTLIRRLTHPSEGRRKCPIDQGYP